ICNKEMPESKFHYFMIVYYNKYKRRAEEIAVRFSFLSELCGTCQDNLIYSEKLPQNSNFS
ncbi:MAG TPA: hypothetical protein VN626_05865, partial [Clostridia bacterium]|nr:hypothetical protein [Clostridia bacterium]